MVRMRNDCVVVAALALTLSAALLSHAEAVVGEKAPAFNLPDTSGQAHQLADYADKYVVLEWLNHECPFVRKHYESGNMQSLQKEYVGKGVVWLSICSSASGKQGYNEPEAAAKLAAEKGSAASAVLLDPEGTVGRLYGAKVTPHMFVIAPDGNLIYQGAIDDIPSPRVSDIEAANNYVRACLDSAMAGKPVERTSTKPYGCGVKYP